MVTETKWKDLLVIVHAVPTDAEKMPVRGGDGTQAKCITDIYLCQEGALAESHNCGNCSVHGVVMQAELPAWYSIVVHC